jgi:hypothetical protein
MGIVSFKMWEDAAANSSGGGGVDGIGIGAKGEPPGKLKNPLNKKKKIESSGSHFKPGSRGAPDDWEARSNLSRNVRRDFWKSFKGKHTK